MMKSSKVVKIFIILAVAASAAWFVWHKAGTAQAQQDKIVRPSYGKVESIISSTGSVQPQNRLEIKPAISGRLEDVLVKEGDMVKKGDVLAWMSSTDRAALLDAAHAKGAETEARWQDVYKATPLISPIDGQVIVRSIEPGQSVTAASVVVVLSDRLVVKAQVDETDIGRVKVGMSVRVSLDAYPDIKVDGKVGHVAYESTTVNNVTVYDVDIVTDTIPEVFRSGMNANIEIVETYREKVLLLTTAAVKQTGKQSYVLRRDKKGELLKKNIITGVTSENNIEVVSGLSDGEEVIITDKAYQLPAQKAAAGSPLAPSFPKMRRGGH